MPLDDLDLRDKDGRPIELTDEQRRVIERVSGSAQQRQESCADCRKPYETGAPGSAEGFCPECAADRRRSGRWYTPPLV